MINITFFFSQSVNLNSMYAMSNIFMIHCIVHSCHR